MIDQLSVKVNLTPPQLQRSADENKEKRKDALPVTPRPLSTQFSFFFPFLSLLYCEGASTEERGVGAVGAALFLVNMIFALGTARKKNDDSPGNDGLTFHLYYVLYCSN